MRQHFYDQLRVYMCIANAYQLNAPITNQFLFLQIYIVLCKTTNFIGLTWENANIGILGYENHICIHIFSKSIIIVGRKSDNSSLTTFFG